MKQYDFTLGFAIMANDPLDARVKLADLLKAIDKTEILKAMRLEDPDALTKYDAEAALDALDALVTAVEDYVDTEGRTHPYIWDDIGKAYNVLRDYDRRPPPNIGKGK